ncbi:Orn/DAP/Arg decarboxylase 2 [Mycobacterium haemophilum DSM 44634]|uniref:amino acid decarboxylase n=1 Tax=Mycobacterium haemophilum TaxID=29311 RepID=UPI000655206C|nr:amino acid decarboxylase [Mycobacterium haemophilum]AKN17558.1 amino acid decarboxylase [Mycobacterium haemophilum DSM 44634]
MELEQDALSLPAIAPPWFRGVTGDPFLLADMAHAVGGPFHVLFPQQFAANLAAFMHAISSAGLDGHVMFAKKANKAGAWLQACAEAGAGVDVASAEELVHALARGVRGTDLVVTGPAKSERLLWLAARHDCLIAIDALDELDRLLALVPYRECVHVLLRVLPEVNPDSRFGFDADELDIALSRCVEQRHRVSMEGFSFHLSGYEVQPRAQLADQLLDRLVDARARGLAATSISIGGGFAVSYFEAQTWARFLHNSNAADFHASKQFAQWYPYHQSPVGADMLAAILASETGCGSATVGEKFIRTDTKLLLEPGRALLDRAGVTVFPVEGFKRRGDYGITTIRGLSMSMSEQWKSSEFLPDPILWPAKEPGDGQLAGPVRSCVGGASCLEYDMLTWRKVVLPREPRHGDLLIYPNTAGYQMDKNESEFHGLRVPPKIVVTHDNRGNFRWQLDENGYQL